MKNITLLVVIQDSAVPESLDREVIISFLPSKLQNLVKLYKFSQEYSAGSIFLSRVQTLCERRVLKSVIPVIIASEDIYNIDNTGDSLKFDFVSKQLKSKFPNLISCVSSTFKAKKSDFIDFNFHKEMPDINKKMAENIVEIYNHIIQNHT